MLSLSLRFTPQFLIEHDKADGSSGRTNQLPNLFLSLFLFLKVKVKVKDSATLGE
jgi:hypothetical protein